MTDTSDIAPGLDAGELTAAFAEVRANGPLVQCITNAVVTNFTANALLAAGAAPAMVDIVGEAGDFARVAGGVLVNLGTPTPEQRTAAREAVAAAGEAGTPWVLDPVAVGALKVRTELAAELVEERPAAVRGNASEILVLAGTGAGGRGVESTDTPEAARAGAEELARRTGAVVAVSGERDLITDGATTVLVTGGDAMLTLVTGAGCALGALVTAFIAGRGGHSVLAAVTAAHVAYGLAAERAAAQAEGPGSFAVALIDALHNLQPDDVAAGARVEVLEPAE